MSYLTWPVGQIVIEVPGATAIFFKQKINFCCDGDKLLSEVITAKSLDEQSIIHALEQLDSRKTSSVNLDELTNQQIIDYILTRFHAVHREQLPELQRLSDRVEKVHGDNPLCPNGLTSLLTDMEVELNQHMEKEENILFPMLAHYASPMVAGPISVMKQEHEEHLAQIASIYQLTNHVTPPEGSCNTWQALYLGLQEFISDLNQHIHTENKILFSRASA